MTSSAERTGRCKSGDVEIFYRLFGDGGAVPLLILHGLSYFSYDWRDIAAALATGRQVASMDMRGFGSSGWSAAGAYKVQDFCGDIVAVLDHLGWPRAVLMGHSMGGRNATYAAAAIPERVARLVLVDYSPTNAKAGSQRVTDTIVDMPARFASVGEAMAYFGADAADAGTRARFEAYLKPDGGGLAIRRDPFFKEMFRRLRDDGVRPDHGADLWDCLGRVACPILVLRGRRSDMFAPETADKVRACNRLIRLVEIDAGHNIAGDAPDALIGEVRAHLA